MESTPLASRYSTVSRGGRRRDAISIRPIRASDTGELERFYAELSEESRHLRFFATTRGLTRRQSTAFCMTDHAHREGFVAVAGEGTPTRRVVGHLCLEPADDAASAEVAIAVSDTLQGRGIGRRLMAAGVAWARACRISALTASMLTTNTAIHRLLGGLGLPTTLRSIEPDVAEVTVHLAMPASAGDLPPDRLDPSDPR